MEGLTDRAGKKLEATLKKSKAPDDKCARFVLALGGGKFTLDKPSKEDLVFEYGDRTVLAVDPRTAQRLAGKTMDYKNGAFCFV